MGPSLSGFPGGTEVKNPPINAGDVASSPGLGRSSGEEQSNPFEYSCLGNPMDRGAWRAIVHGVAKSQARLSIHTQCQYCLVSKEKVKKLNSR